MNAISLVLLFSFCTSSTFSQTFLTNGQVFDFNIGDIIQIRAQVSGPGSGGPPGYVTSKYLSRSLSTNSDSIEYSIQRSTYSPPSCQTCTAFYAMDTIIQAITNLNSPVEHNNQTTCLFIGDTLYFDYCNKQVWEEFPALDTGCFEPTAHTTRFVEGLGGPYYTKMEPSGGPTYTQFELIYYHKLPDSCGTFVSSISESEKNIFGIDLFPNPASDRIEIKSTRSFMFYDISDIEGKIYDQGKMSNSSINISPLKKGTYFIRLYTEDYKVTTKIFLKL